MQDSGSQSFLIRRKKRVSAPLPASRLAELSAAGVVAADDEVLDAVSRAMIGAARDQPWYRAPADGATAGKAGLLAGRHLLGLHYSLPRLAIAFAIAAVADLVGWVFSFAPPVGFVVDAVIALLIWVALGRPLVLIPVFIVESIPGLNFIPLWSLVVIGIGVYGGIPGGAKPPVDGPIGTAIGPIQDALTRHAKKP